MVFGFRGLEFFLYSKSSVGWGAELSSTIDQGTSVATPMRDALEAAYPGTEWVVLVHEAGRYSRSYRFREHLWIDYNGFSWVIFRYV